MKLKSTFDTGLLVALTKLVYAVLNRLCPCSAGYACEWVYPYGWVPEMGCPVHD